MILKLLPVCFLLHFVQSYGKIQREVENLFPEVSMRVDEIIQYHGYTVENHTIQTSDGYLITLQRIPHGKTNTTKNGKPVLIMHGILCSSAIWVTNTPDKNLPYILADAGYDVWLGNVRGTLFGRENIHLSVDLKKFWDFSFHEMGQLDLSATIDHILRVTTSKQIYFVGHSMGNSMLFSLLSSQPKYNMAIKTLFALAPIAQLNHVRSPIKYLAPISKQAAWVLSLLGLGNGEFSANTKLHKILSNTVCNSPLQVICESILFMLCGFDKDQFNSTRLPVYLHHTPAGTSVKNLLHFAQIVESKRFQEYDYGFDENVRRYQQHIPPKYNLTRITTPVALFWGDNDYLANPNDVAWLATQIPSLVLKHRVAYDSFSHLDFLWAKDIKELVYNKLLQVMDDLWKN